MELQIKKRLNIFIPILFFFYACMSNDDPIVIGDPVGPISAEDFKTVPVPTYQIVLEAYEIIKDISPNLVESENQELSIALFEEVKKISASNHSSNGNVLQDPFLERLSEEEWKLVLINPYKGYLAFFALKISFSDSANSFTCDPDLSLWDTKADALRHALWNALMVQQIEIEFVEKLVNAHEMISDPDESSLMDLHNSKIGRDLASKYPEANPDELLTILIQYDFMFLENGESIPSDYLGLVFLDGIKKYDVKMKGSFSNPDSGGPWEIEFDIYECGQVIRGNFTIIRGSERQERRFSGSMVNGTLQLEVSDPLVFENPRGLYACKGMKMNLSGDENSLEGGWTASNCYRGGIVSLSKVE